MNTFLALAEHTDGVELKQLEPLTTLLIWTWNSLYRVIIADGSDIVVQGGQLFPDPTPAHVEGATDGGSALKPGWIGVGSLLVLRASGRHIVTSPVVAIATAPSAASMVHRAPPQRHRIALAVDSFAHERLPCRSR